MITFMPANGISAFSIARFRTAQPKRDTVLRWLDGYAILLIRSVISSRRLTLAASYDRKTSHFTESIPRLGAAQ
jgi:hypothetical protein